MSFLDCVMQDNTLGSFNVHIGIIVDELWTGVICEQGIGLLNLVSKDLL